MWNPFRASRQRREHEAAARSAERLAFLETLSIIAENFSKAQEASHYAVAEMAKASEAQASALREHLALFSVAQAPESRVMRDIDEYNAELQRGAFPFESEPKDQLAWVLRASNDE